MIETVKAFRQLDFKVVSRDKQAAEGAFEDVEVSVLS